MFYGALKFRMKATIASIDHRVTELFWGDVWGSIAIEFVLLFLLSGLYLSIKLDILPWASRLLS